MYYNHMRTDLIWHLILSMDAPIRTPILESEFEYAGIGPEFVVIALELMMSLPNLIRLIQDSYVTREIMSEK